jgi:hypothetical protein
MAGAEHLRSHAAHLLAMALKAHENGDHDFAELLTARAMHYIDDAAAAAHVVQQQQQPPLKKGDE